MKELTEHQSVIVGDVIRQEIFKKDRETMLIRLVGAHSHGFASVDSDVDLMGVHILPGRSFLGLSEPENMRLSRMETIQGVEIDYSSYELKTVASKLLAGAGNYLEMLIGGGSHWESHYDAREARLAEFRQLASRNISKKYHRHYRGFAYGQSKEIEKAENPTVKSMLYVIRLCLTGAYLMRTGDLESNIFKLEHLFDLSGVQAVVDSKTTEKATKIDAKLFEETKALMEECFRILDKEAEDSELPETPQAAQAMEDFVIDVRKTTI